MAVGSLFARTLGYTARWRISEVVASSLVVVIFSSLSDIICHVRSEDPINWPNMALLASMIAPGSLIALADFRAVLALRILGEVASVL